MHAHTYAYTHTCMPSADFGQRAFQVRDIEGIEGIVGVRRPTDVVGPTIL